MLSILGTNISEKEKEIIDITKDKEYIDKDIITKQPNRSILQIF